MSHRGALRRAPSCITWVCVLEKFQKEHGERDHTALIKAWNAQNAKSNQIVGAKAHPVENILTLMDQACKDELVAHFSEHVFFFLGGGNMCVE